MLGVYVTTTDRRFLGCARNDRGKDGNDRGKDGNDRGKDGNDGRKDGNDRGKDGNDGQSCIFSVKIVYLRNMDMPLNQSILIDTEAVVRKVNHGKLLPRPVMSFIRKLVHEEDFNRNFSKGKVGPDFIDCFFEDINVTLEIIGGENIPKEGLFTFASNHPLGGADAGLEVGWLARKYNDKVITPANSFLLHIKQLAHYLIPVNKMGGQPRELAGLLNEAFHSDRQVLYFPAGACSRKVNGIITDLEWKKTFITKSRETKRNIIPIWFSGQNSKRFYRIAAFRKFFKIKLNLEMFTLPDELFRYRGQHFKMVIGKPIPYGTFTSEKTDVQWAQYVKDQVYALKQD